MKNRVLALLLALTMLFGLMLPVGAADENEVTGYCVPMDEDAAPAEAVKADDVPTEAEAYAAMIALKSQYPEGMRWTNDDFYAWNGGYFYGGYGCAAFAFILSDAAFGTLPVEVYTSFAYEDVRVGDILRINNDRHSVIVLEVYSSYVVIAEGNYNSSIHWGRTLTKSQVLAADYIMTRYPHTHNYVISTVQPTCTTGGYTVATCSICGDEYYPNSIGPLGHSWDNGRVLVAPTETSTGTVRYTCTRAGCDAYYDDVIPMIDPECPSSRFYDAPAEGNWAHAGIDYCIENGLMNGVSSVAFNPNGSVTRAQLVTILWRYEGEPMPNDQSMSMDSEGNVWCGEFYDNAPDQWYTDAVIWAYENDITTGYPGNLFKPQNSITREQIATILYRYFGEPAVGGDVLATFPDAEQVSSYAAKSMNWAVQEGLINGIGVQGTSYLRPKDTATRAQIAAIMMRALENG